MLLTQSFTASILVCLLSYAVALDGDSPAVLLNPITLQKFSQTALRLVNGAVNVTAVNLAALNSCRKFAATSAILAQRFKNPKANATTVEKRSAWKLGLTDYGSDVLWYGSISVGSPPQPFLVDFDTGSSNFVLVRSTCVGTYCSRNTGGIPRKQYSAESSYTSSVTAIPFSATYTGGLSPTSGLVVYDVVRFGRLSVRYGAICAATSVGGSVASLGLDGLVGLAYPALSAAGTVSLPFTLFNEAVISQNVFAFRLSSIPGKSTLDMGYINTNGYTGTPVYYPIAIDPNYGRYTYYQIANSVANVNGVPVPATNSYYIIDSGSTLIMAPMATAAAFWAQVPGSAPYTPVAGFYTFPCSSTPTVSFSFGGSNVQHKVALNDFNLGYVDHAGGKCLGAYIGADTGLGSRTIIGDTFMKNWYVSFDVTNSRIGLATPV